MRDCPPEKEEQMAWRIAGDYFENCSCNVLCPCITSSLQEPADYDRCRVPLVCQIREGSFDDVSLDGLCFIVVADTPAVMGEGNWRVGVYIDERADERQTDALGTILSGEAGGPLSVLAPLIGEQLGVKKVPIQYESDGHRRRVVVPGIMEFEVEGITAPESDEVMEITNTIHPMGANLAIATSTKGVYDDPDFNLSFDNTGKNGHYREFAWQG
jgi:hypothetical protein